MYYNNKDKSTLSFISILIIIIIIFWFLESIVGANTYNNGICKNCGGHYEFQNAVGHHAVTDYVYKCDKCGNLIEINTYYKE